MLARRRPATEVRNQRCDCLSALFYIEGGKGELAQRVAYVGKCISGLLLADPAAADVDLPVWEGIGWGENEEDLMSVSSEEA